MLPDMRVKQLVAASVGMARLGLPEAFVQPLISAFEHKVRAGAQQLAGASTPLPACRHGAASMSAGQPRCTCTCTPVQAHTCTQSQSDPHLLVLQLAVEGAEVHHSELARLVKELPHLPGVQPSSPFCTLVSARAPPLLHACPAVPSRCSLPVLKR